MASTEPPAAPQLSTWTDRRLLHMAALSLPGAIPLSLVLSTVPAWLADQKVPATVIGLLSLAGLPWTLKVLWAPILDRWRLPFGGRRRGWMMAAQVGLLISIGSVGFLDPQRAELVIGLCFLIAFFSASQDIAMDAYAVELMKPEQQSRGTSLRTTFYRLGMLIAGGFAIAAAEATPWSIVFLALAGVMLLGLLLAGTGSEPEVAEQAPKSLQQAIVEPIVSYFKRPGALTVAAFILLYKFGDNMTQTVLSPFFLQELHISKLDFGSLQKTLGFASTIAGTLLGGEAVARIGLSRCLWLFGLFQAGANLFYVATAQSGGYAPFMYAAIVAEFGSAGMGTAALVTLITRITDKRYTATQFALLTGVMGLGRTLAGPVAGRLADLVGYVPTFLAALLACLPGLLFLSRFASPRSAEPTLP